MGLLLYLRSYDGMQPRSDQLKEKHFHKHATKSTTTTYKIGVIEEDGC